MRGKWEEKAFLLLFHGEEQQLPATWDGADVGEKYGGFPGFSLSVVIFTSCVALSFQSTSLPFLIEQPYALYTSRLFVSRGAVHTPSSPVALSFVFFLCHSYHLIISNAYTHFSKGAVASDCAWGVLCPSLQFKYVR